MHTISNIYDIIFDINLENDTFISTTIFNIKEIEDGPMAESPIYKIICKEGIPIYREYTELSYDQIEPFFLFY
jgi:hypothetical protein